MKSIFLTISLLSALMLTAFAQQAPSTKNPAETSELSHFVPLEKLDNVDLWNLFRIRDIHFTRIEFKDMNLREAVEHLVELSSQQDTNPSQYKGASIRLMKTTREPDDIIVNMKLSDSNYIHVMNEICKATGHLWTMEGRILVLYPEDAIRSD